ncbi:MAG: Rho termination factor N-terminal domain-containing protein, partial [Mycobacterium sp.]
MTDTDLNVITAGESTDGNQQSDTVTTNIQDAPTTPSVEKGAGSLSTMVLPELRALANRAGVKGTSGMRKN